jgi:hypothetical protein
MTNPVTEFLSPAFLACLKNNRTTKNLKLAARVKSRAPCGIRKPSELEHSKRQVTRGTKIIYGARLFG